jgi:hypothetical protein
MRPIVFAALISLSACATAAPRPACGCLPPRPEPVMPMPILSPESEALLVIEALETGCRGMGTPGGLLRIAQSEDRIRVIPKTQHVSCAVEVDGTSARTAATDAALLAYADSQDLTWNVRDSHPIWSDGRRVVRRVRGESGQGEPEMSWSFTQFEAPSDTITTLRIEWDDRAL